MVHVPEGTTAADEISRAELALATRNAGMPLEALAQDITPIGLHYLLIHYDIPFVDATTWRLALDGNVDNPMTLSLDDVRARPSVTVPVTMECAGNGRTLFSPRAISQPWGLEAVGTAEWTGTPLAPLLREAGLRSDTVEFVFTGLDSGIEGGAVQRYERSLTVADALRDEVLLAYALNGEPLPPQHGFPLRLLVPGWYGMTSVKWLAQISAVTRPFEGYQMVKAYRLRSDSDDPGVPLNRIAVRSLMVPPGIPEFATRIRHVPSGGCRLTGKAWSGHGPIVRVEVSDDAGRTWADADVGAARGPHAWHPWSFEWRPRAAGEVELRSRATDAAGNSQPDNGVWNLGGYAGNGVQRVAVVVDE